MATKSTNNNAKSTTSKKSTTTTKKKPAAPKKPKAKFQVGLYAEIIDDIYHVSFTFIPEEGSDYTDTRIMDFRFDDDHVVSLADFDYSHATPIVVPYYSKYDFTSAKDCQNPGKKLTEIVHNEYEKAREFAIRSLGNLLQDSYDVEIIGYQQIKGTKMERFFEQLCIFIMIQNHYSIVGYSLPKSFAGTNHGESVMQFGDHLLRKVTGKHKFRPFRDKDDDKKKKKSENVDKRRAVMRMLADALVYANVSTEEKYLHIKFGLTADFNEIDGLFDLDVRLDPEASPAAMVLRMYYQVENIFDSMISRDDRQSAYEADIISPNVHNFIKKLVDHDLNFNNVLGNLTLYLIGLLGWMRINNNTSEVSIDKFVESAIIDNSYALNLPKPVGIWIEEASIISK